jgi:2-deoxy-D-gluconate 3-dehydrogenase
MARALARAGASVALHASRTEPADLAARLASDHGVGTACLIADLEQRDAADRLVPQALDRFGRLDILVNNAGTIRRAEATLHSDEDWDAVIEINLSSVFRLCQAAGRHMLARGRGKIVNIASLLSFQGGIRVPAYAAAKGGVAQLTKALANEWAGRGVNVNAIAPGYMRTDNTKALIEDPVRSRQILGRIPAGRWGEPDDVSGAVVFLASHASDYVHGHVLVVDGGWMGR